jgi:competence protein ComGC
MEGAMKPKQGFTLAEALLVLLVAVVVAFAVIPTVISNSLAGQPTGIRAVEK